MSRRVPNPKNRVAETVERRIRELAVEQPAWGHTRMANELAKEGIRVSPTGVRGVWVRHDLNTMAKRLKALEAKVADQDAKMAATNVRLKAVEDEKAARDLAEQRALEAKALGQEANRAKVTLENLFDRPDLRSAVVSLVSLAKHVEDAGGAAAADALIAIAATACTALKKLGSQEIKLAQDLGEMTTKTFAAFSDRNVVRAERSILENDRQVARCRAHGFTPLAARRIAARPTPAH